jgi:putative ABC transport system substrate-binding protein
MRAVGYAGADRAEFLARSSGGDTTKLAPLAAELVAQKVDLIVAVTPSAVRAAKAATSTIPIVAHDLESDPVAEGYVASLARPGGNITGVFSDFPNFGMKWLELLKEVIPTLSSVVVLRDRATAPMQLDAVEAAAKLLTVKITVLDAGAISEMPRIFQAAGDLHPDAVIILASPLFGTDPKLIADLALSHHLPTSTLFPELARAGGMIGYGPNLLDAFRLAGTMVVRILKGARPADLPVERPTQFEMVVNLRTAKALGIIIPAAVQLRADEVIE